MSALLSPPAGRPGFAAHRSHTCRRRPGGRCRLPARRPFEARTGAMKCWWSRG